MHPCHVFPSHPYVSANLPPLSSFSCAQTGIDLLHCQQADKSESNAVWSYQSNPDDPFLSELHATTASCLNHGNARKLCRSEEHTSELQSRENLVCRLLLE